MRIAIDFDETLTADADLWRRFLSVAIDLGHHCVCVTARRATDDNLDTITEWMHSHGIDLPIFFTSLGSKVDYMTKRGLRVDIWINDDPRKCALGH
jgi:hypothetical protein